MRDRILSEFEMTELVSLFRYGQDNLSVDIIIFNGNIQIIINSWTNLVTFHFILGHKVDSFWRNGWRNGW